MAVADTAFFSGPFAIEYQLVGIWTDALLAFAAVRLDHAAAAFPHVTFSLYLYEAPVDVQEPVRLFPQTTGLGVTELSVALEAVHCA